MIISCKIGKHLAIIATLAILLSTSQPSALENTQAYDNFKATHITDFAKDNTLKKDPKHITVDTAISVGRWCICAEHLRNNNLRQMASPIDWMRIKDLTDVAHLFETKFEDFFENFKITEKRRKNGNRTVYDTKNHIESIHYMPANIPFKKAFAEFKATMNRRAKRLDKKLSESKSVLLLNCREYPGKFGKNSTDKELKEFAIRFANAYPNLEKIYLIDIHNEKIKKINKRIIFKNRKFEIIQYRFNNIDHKNFLPPFGNANAWNKILKNVKLNPEKSSV